MLRGLSVGLAAGAATVLVAFFLPSSLRRPLVGVLLGVAAGVYPGFARDEAPLERRLQWAVAGVFALVAALGVAVSAWWLAAGWALHAAWDVRHHAGRRGDWIPEGYPMLCLAYDLVLASFAAVLATGSGAA